MHDSVSPLQGANLSLAEFLRPNAAWKNDVLGALCFSVASPRPHIQKDADVPCLCVPMPRMDAADSKYPAVLKIGILIIVAS